jgi:hypothetical protein
MIPRKRATRIADNIIEIVKESRMKILFSKTPAKKSSLSIKCSISKKLLDLFNILIVCFK